MSGSGPETDPFRNPTANSNTDDVSAPSVSSSTSSPLQCFFAQEVHYQSVLQLPPFVDPTMSVLAFSKREPHQFVRYANGVYGTQFHPEYNAPFMKALGPFLRFEGEEEREAYDTSLLQPASVSAAVVLEFLNLVASS